MSNVKILPLNVNIRALNICERLNKYGFQAFIVGGCIRDLLLQLTPKNWDITTDATPSQVKKLFPETILTELSQGIVTVVIEKEHFKVSTFRLDGKYHDEKNPEKLFFVQEIEPDLARRDFTINAIAYDPIGCYLLDPHYGIEDLKNKVIRTIGKPANKIQEDGLRILRAIRFAASLNFEIEKKTWIDIKNYVRVLDNVSKARIRDEIIKILKYNPSKGMDLISESHALGLIFPHLFTLVDLYESIDNLDVCYGDWETKLAFLYCSGQLEDMKNDLTALEFSNDQIRKIILLISLLAKYHVFNIKDTPLAYRSFMATIKNHAPEPWEDTFQQFILLSESKKLKSREMLYKYMDEPVLSKKEMAINKSDLIKAGITPGPILNGILEACYLEILRSHRNNNKPYLLKFATGI